MTKTKSLNKPAAFLFVYPGTHKLYFMYDLAQLTVSTWANKYGLMNTVYIEFWSIHITCL